MQLGSVNKHIDNGGVTVTVVQDETEFKNISIHFKTGYFGYPEVSSQLNLWGILGKDFLKELGVMLISASEKISEKAEFDE